MVLCPAWHFSLHDTWSSIKPCPQLQAASKIVCTLGPACRDVETLMKLINAGMTAARVDLTVCHPSALPALTPQRAQFTCADGVLCLEKASWVEQVRLC